MPWISVNNQLRWSNDDAQQAQRGEEGSPLPEVSAPSSAGQAEEGGQGGVPEARMSLELGSKLRVKARWVVEQIDAFDRRCSEAEYTQIDEVWDLLDEIRTQLRMEPKQPTDQSSRMCAPKEETA